MANLKSNIQFLVLSCPGIIGNEVEVMHSEFIAVLCFHIIATGYIDNIFLNILPYHKPGATTQTKSLSLSDSVEPISAMSTQFLSGFQFYNRSLFLSKETTDKIIIIYLSQETNALAIFSPCTR